MPEISIIVPARNEAGNLPALLAGIVAACEGGIEGRAFEVIVVDDASQDDTGGVVTAAAAKDPRIRLLTNRANAGQSASVHSGVLAAGGDLIATLDGDGQNPPAELPNLLAPFFAPDCPDDLGLVAGQRVKRRDTWSKRTASKIANNVRSFVLKDATRDTGCGLKAFRREAFLRLPYFDHMHRYLPALFARDGWRVAHVDVSHQAREAGASNYSNLQRGLVGVVDLFGVFWLIRRKKRAYADIGAAPQAPDRQTGPK